MSELIVLTVEQADKLFPADAKTGSRERLSQAGHAICPIPLEGDLEFILPVEVLDDPKHAEALKMLAGETYDAKAIEALPLEKRPAPVLTKDAVNLKSAALKREVLAAEFKISTLDVAIEAPIESDKG
jgi:hypothetical protein